MVSGPNGPDGRAILDLAAGGFIFDFVFLGHHGDDRRCRMGVDPKTSVIDPSGEAHGVPGLCIADASVFPTSLGVNPQLTTMAVSTKLAQGWV